MDWFAKHEPVRKLCKLLSKLFDQEKPSRLTSKHEQVRKPLNLLNNFFNHENIPRKWIGSQSMNQFASFSLFYATSSTKKTVLV